MNPFEKVKYHGLKNQGATCYLNSVLQVLFMTEDFRAAVKRDNSKNPDTEFIDHHLTTLFDDLQKGRAYTYKITRKLGINGVYEQRDAAEYFEKILSLTSPDASQIFHGQLTHKTICSTCGMETDTDGAFWHLPLALVDSCSECYSVVNGIEEYFKDADFSGENQMYCDQCDDKSDAIIKCVVKRHPEVLMLLLKRFEFNYSYMTYVKNNCTVQVPYTLEIPENQRYELYAVVDHYGDLRSGYHTATIKSKDDGTWYTFNDATVTLPDYQPFQVDNFKKSFSAYLLFYRKVNVHAEDTCNQDIREMSSPGDLSFAASDNNDQHKVAGKIGWAVSDRLAIHGHPNKQDEMSEEQRRVMDVKTEKVGKTGDDEESEKKEKLRAKYPDRDPEYQDKVGLSDIRLNTHANLGGSQEVGQHYGLNFFGVAKPGDWKRMEKVDKGGKTGEDKRGKASVGRKFLTISDLYGRVGGIEESEGAGQASNDVVVAVSINRNVETGTEGLPPDPRSNVESQHSMPSNSQEYKEERTDSSYYPQDAHDEIIMNNKDMRGKVEADDRAKKRENLSKENPLEESVEDQDNDSKRQKTPDAHFDFKLTVSDRLVIQGHPNKQDEMSEEQRRVMDVKTNKVGKTGDDEESEKRGKSRTKYPDKDSEYQEKLGLVGIGLNTHANLGGSQEVGQHYGLQLFSVAKQGDWKGMEKLDKEGKTGEDKRGKASVGRKFLTISDLYGRVGEIEKSEGAGQASNDVVVAVSINRNVETGTEGLPPDPRSSVESQHSIPSNSQEYKEERTDSSYYPQDAHAEIIMNDKDMRGKAEADDRAKKRENLSKENPLKESVEDQDNDSGRQKTPDAHFYFKPTVRDRLVIQGLKPFSVNEQGNVRTMKREDKEGKTGADERGKASDGRKFLKISDLYR